MRLVNYEISNDTLLNVVCEMDNVHIKDSTFLENQLGLYASRPFVKGINNKYFYFIIKINYYY